MLHFIDTDGTVLDTIRLDGDQLVYETGDAREIVESLRQHRMPPGRRRDADLYGRLSERGWSNGYVTIRAATP